MAPHCTHPGHGQRLDNHRWQSCDLSCLNGLQDVIDASQQVTAAGPIAEPAGPSLPRPKGRPRQYAHQIDGQPMHQQHPVQVQFSHQQAQPIQSNSWQSETNQPQMYTMAHSATRTPSAAPSVLVKQPQLRFHQPFLQPAAALTRLYSADGSASSAPLDDEGASPSAAEQQQPQLESSPRASTAAAEPAAPNMAVAGSVSGGSLYACTPPGRPPGRRLSVVRWVLNQRALWREGQLTPVQMQYMTILGRSPFGCCYFYCSCAAIPSTIKGHC